MGARLVLVKHSHVDVVPGRAPRTWELATEGRRRAAVLAHRLAEFDVARVMSSIEPKAVETAEIVAQRLGVPAATAPGLHEQLRDTAPFLAADDFAPAVAWLFDEPHELVFGEASAAAAADRFRAAVEALLGDGRAPDTTAAGREQMAGAHGVRWRSSRASNDVHRRGPLGRTRYLSCTHAHKLAYGRMVGTWTRTRSVRWLVRSFSMPSSVWSRVCSGPVRESDEDLASS